VLTFPFLVLNELAILRIEREGKLSELSGGERSPPFRFSCSRSRWSSSGAAPAMKGVDDAFLGVGDKPYAPGPPLFLSSASSFLFQYFFILLFA
jgi:hypothetical protein